MLAVNLEVPLYQTYARTSGYGTGSTSFVFAAYVLGLLPTIVLFGGVSDRIGRKRTLIVALLCALAATLVMMISPTMPALFLARVLQGIGVGLSLGTGTAYLMELTDKTHRVPVYTGFATTLGIGGGALITSISLFYKHTRIPLSYWATIIATMLCMLFIAFLPESKRFSSGKMARLPHFPSGTIVFGLTIIIAWSVTGVIIALLPFALEDRHLGDWVGIMVFLSISTGVLVQPLARRLSPFHAIKIGMVLVSLSCLFLFAGAWHGAISLVLLGAMLGGVSSFGFSYIGGLSAVVHASQNETARAVSGYFLMAYLGLGLPAILVGSLGKIFGLFSALSVFGVFIVLMNSVLWIRLNSVSNCP
jgi:predicted MFS family arabinose efflux permease